MWILVLVRVVFGGGIDLDPFSERKCNRERVRANKYYSESHDGYSRVNPWFKKVFANPPGGTTNGKSNMGRALKRAVKEFEEGNIECCIMVLKVAVGYHWFETVYTLPHVFLRDKPKFVNPERPDVVSSTPHGYVVVYIGNNEGAFIEAFQDVGFIPGVGVSWAANRSI